MAVDLTSRRDCDSPDGRDSPVRLTSPGASRPLSPVPPCLPSPITPRPSSPDGRDSPVRLTSSSTPRPQSPVTPRPHDTSTGSISDETTPRAATPSRGRRKNKRKMSEPRRLSDFGDEETTKKARVEEEDSGVESTSASGSADRSPVDEVGAARVPGIYPPTIMVPAYLPYPYTFINPAMSSLQSLRMMNPGQLPVSASLPVPTSSSNSNSNANGQSTKPSTSRKSSRKSGADTSPPREFPPHVETLHDAIRSDPTVAPPLPPLEDGVDQADDEARRQYKTMTVERRVEANARERTRVHTISAAFEALRRAVPAYSYNQKLSKLAILRIACCYILSLSRLADKDYSRDQSRPSFRECVELTTRTIQAEGRAKKRH